MADEAKRPACPECGEEGSIYVAIDLTWNAEAQRWNVDQQHEADLFEEAGDCTSCDARFEPVEAGFPDPCDIGSDERVDSIASACMESEAPAVADWHRVAGNAALTSKSPNDGRTAALYRHAEAAALLKAVFAHDATLSAADMLKVAARIAERAAEAA